MATTRKARHGSQPSWNTNHAEIMVRVAVVRTTAHGRAWMEFFFGSTLTFRQPSGRCQNHASPAQNPDGSGAGFLARHDGVWILASRHR